MPTRQKTPNFLKRRQCNLIQLKKKKFIYKETEEMWPGEKSGNLKRSRKDRDD